MFWRSLRAGAIRESGRGRAGDRTDPARARSRALTGLLCASRVPTSAYEDGGYGFARLGRVELHLGVDAAGPPASAYLFVDDADRLAAAWAANGAEVHPPVDTPWRQHEGVLVDPDGNRIRFGWPVRSQP